jgi:hypothetical protein
MNKRLLFYVLLSFSCLSSPSAHADFLDWSFSWERLPLTIAADDGGSGGITLALGAAGTTGAPEITAVTLTTFSSAPVESPDTISDGAYTLTLTLTDNPSGEVSGPLTFSGVFEGTVWDTGADIKHSFTEPTVREVTLGDHDYSITIGPYAAPGGPTSGIEGFIKATVSVTDSTGGGGGGGGGDPVEETPEPSSLALAGLACGVVALARRRSRKSAAVAG